MKKLFRIFVWQTWQIFSAVVYSQQVSNYQVFLAEADYPDQPKSSIIIRKFEYNNQPFYLSVNTDSLFTRLIPAIHRNIQPVTRVSLYQFYGSTAYIRALKQAEQNASTLQDAGIVHSFPAEKGVVLTVDLCPSSKPLDREFFTKVIQSFLPEEKPVPLAVAITGVWMEGHPQDLQWLLSLLHSSEIEITWINHSFHHFYNKQLPLSKNFLLEKGTDMNYEILQTEIGMLENGMIPSVFFRFPGLISDGEIVKKVIDYGLIPTGSDAWLAKNQQPTPGSIVLVHGNGNEPLGIDKFLELLGTEKSNIKNMNWLLYDLREGVAEEEAGKK